MKISRALISVSDKSGVAAFARAERPVTLIVPDGGDATIAGADLRRSPGEVRRRIGYVAQGGSTWDTVTAREELVLQARMYGIGKARADWLWSGERRIVHLTVASASGGAVDGALATNLRQALDGARDIHQTVLVASFQPVHDRDHALDAHAELKRAMPGQPHM